MTTPRWGTLEELLLACAVNRYGTTDWDSIAMEVQSRCFDPSFPFSSQDCRSQFDDLKRRFMFHDHDDSASLTPMVDELRRIRVKELRREVLRRDVSIMLLESKVKRLEEERKRSLKEELVTDLKDDQDGSEGNRKPLPSTNVGNSIPGEDTDDREKRSFHESNTTKNGESGAIQDQVKLESIEPTRNEHGPVRTATESESERKPSPIGDSIRDEEEHEANASRTDGVGNSLESNCESKPEEEDSKHQSSDVQSSASLSLSKQKRRRRSGGADAAPAPPRRGYISGEDVERHKVSPAIKRLSTVKSGPLVKILEMISSHPLSSIIEQRLQSQVIDIEKAQRRRVDLVDRTAYLAWAARDLVKKGLWESRRYKSLIRQHIDLQILKSRLEEGIYSKSNCRFFRDLLLLYNNVIVFFPRTSPENAAALELRALVMQKMNDNLNAQPPVPGKPKSEQESHKFSRSGKSSTLAACSKGGSVKVMSETGSGIGDEKKSDIEEKGNVVDNKKETNGSSLKILRKDTRAKKTTGSNALPGRKRPVMSSKNGDGKRESGGNELSSHVALEVKNEKKELNAKQKRGAARFLKRMKRNSQSQEKCDEEEIGSDNGEVNGLKENRRNRKREEKRGGESRNSGGGREKTDVDKKVKRGKGRPPKRAEPEPSETQEGDSGRGDREEAVVGNGGRRRRKRLRKR